SVTRLPIPIGGCGLRRLSGSPEGGIATIPGCLTGESEERETWTAESLRTASAKEKSFCSAVMEETSAVDVLGQHSGSQGPEWDLVNVVKRELRYVRNVIGREKVLIQLESLILAQSERWRQA